MSGSKGLSVWGLYENRPGELGKLVGIFSTVDKARNCVLIQPLLSSGWQRRSVFKGRIVWVAEARELEKSVEGNFSFSVEEIEIDRLVEED